MRIIGCDLHARQQTLAMLDRETGEVVNLTLMHEGNQVREFYSQLPRPVLVGIEATGSMHWFLNLMEELGIECRVGHPATIRAAAPRRQKTDRLDADLILKLVAENRFPAIWLPTKEVLDLRALVLHRHQWVRIRTRIQNALQAMYKKMEEEIETLTQQVAEQAEQRSGARRLMTHPGVGPVTALATDVFLGNPKRFLDGKALASYVGIIPREYSSGGKQRFGGVTKQGSPLLRFLWCEAGAHAVRRDPELKRFYRRKLVQKGLGKARVAVARKLGIRLWIMLRDEIDYQEFCRRGQMQQKTVRPVAGMPETGNGAKSHRPDDEATRLPES